MRVPMKSWEVGPTAYAGPTSPARPDRTELDALSAPSGPATSLARLLHQSGRTADARNVLEPVYSRFTEGFGRVDLKAAADLLSQFH